MVGFLQSPTSEETVKEEKEDIFLAASKKTSSVPDDPLELCIPELEDFSASFSDSFLDFDTLNSWLLEGDTGFQDMADLGVNDLVDLGSGGDQFEGSKGNLGVCGEICGKDVVGEVIGGKEENLKVLEEEIGVVEEVLEKENGGVEEVFEKGVLGGDGSTGNLGGLSLGCLIEEQLGKVSLEGRPPLNSVPENVNVGGGEAGPGGARVSDAGGVVGNGMKIGDNGGGEESDSESSSASSSFSSSSSSSSSSDEEEEDEESGEMSGKKKKKVERSDVEDGEILLSDAEEEMVAWGEDEDEDADDDGGGSRPILSKNEVKDLPPVPSVDVTLEPHHQTVPVGTILSVIGSQVIVEGVEKHSPLDEGSILWITESRLPLGIIDEIFGPVKNPYYIIRYNSEAEVPAGIQQGTLISFVQEFANRILNDKSLYQKGYDASGENDEEQSEMEFSDDEKEAEYKKALKMKKRGTNSNESKPGNRRKEQRQVSNRKGNWNKNQDSVGSSLNQENSPSPSGFRHNGPSPSGFRQGSGGDQAGVRPFTQTPQGHNGPSPSGFRQGSGGDQAGVHPFTQTPQGHNGPSPSGFRQGSGGDQAGVRPFTQTPQGHNGPSPPGFRQGSGGDQAGVHPFTQMPQGPGFSAPNGLWNTGFPHQQQQSVDLTANLWMQQNLPFPFYQNPVQVNAAFQQQISSVPGLPMNFNAMGGQANFGGAPMLAPWAMGMDPNVLNSLQFGMGLQAQPAPLPLNVGGEQGVQPQGSQISHNVQQPPAAFNFNQGGGRGGSAGGEQGVQPQGSQISQNVQQPSAAFNFNQGGVRGGGINGGSGNGGGRGGGGGRRGHHRGRGRFGGGRGRHS